MATTTILGKEITALSASYALTASFALNGGGGGGSTDTGSLLTTASFSNPNLTFTKGNASTFNVSLSSLVPTSASYATTSSFASTASFVNALTQNVTINGNLTVTGTSSINFISQSTLNIATNLITVNTNTPTVRFGGLAVLDSGSSPQRSGSILLDSVNDQWIFVHQNTGGAVTSSVFLQGPQTYNNIGNETNLTVNRLPKSVLAEHLGDSNITDNGTFVSINSNSQITGSLIVSAGITATSSYATQATSAFTASYVLTAQTASLALRASGSLTGSLLGTATTASYVLNAVTASYVLLAQTASYVLNAVTASYVLLAQTASYVLNAVTASYVLTAQTASYVLNAQTSSLALRASGSLTGSLLGTATTASYVLQAVSSSFASTASYVANASSFPFTGSAQITGSLTLTGSLRGQVSALSIASNTASMNVGSNNFFTLALVDGTTTHISASNIQPGQTINLRVTQGASGTGQVTFQSAIDQPSGSAYTPTLFANAVDIITFVSFDTSALYLSYIKRLI
jgi:hypothetical protein